ncbi:multidrug resistance protein 4 [Rickenella mellea]|uniref:Multidrug resistance protein 4 n=1 Tax=Rickenella mellea TaxID=50990 RepID=A0A4R5XF56_9AGAM|nr:multidrug resistance protein 4 [Rickenella mellea]
MAPTHEIKLSSFPSKSTIAPKPSQASIVDPVIADKPDDEQRVSEGESQEISFNFDQPNKENATVLVEPDPLDDEWLTDTRNPRNWTNGKKWTMALIVALYTFISPVSSSMMSPLLPEIALHFDIRSSTVISLTLSIFLLAYALGPLVLGPLSEIYGRTWVLHLSNIFSLAFSLGCAYAPNTTSLIVFRFFSGIGGSAPVTIGAGSISDLWNERERASAMALYSLGPLLGPSLGTVAGGFIGEKIGYRWIFLIIAILSGLSAVLGITFLRETYGPVIQLRIARRAAADKEKLSPSQRLILESQPSVKDILWINLSRPMALLFQSFICFILSLYMALLYGYYYLMFATFPTLFQDTYKFSTGIAGLAYLGPGVGCILSTFYNSLIAEKIYNKLADKNGGVGKPEYRMPAFIFASPLVPIGLFWYGWSAQEQLHFMMPIVGAGIFGFGLMCTYLPISLYLVDAFKYAASAIAAATVFRSLLGFAFPLFGAQMFKAMGNGGGYSFLAGLAIITGIPFPIWIYYRGEKIRARSNLTR